MYICAPQRVQMYLYSLDIHMQTARFVAAVLLLCSLDAGAVSIVPNPVSLVESGDTLSGRRVSRQSSRIDSKLAEEEYSIVISPKGVKISGGSPKALFWADQTMLQIKAQSPQGKLPCLEIHDRPAFPYRGMLIDCSRHFLSVDEVKACIDLMTLHKLNVLHWHLTDDQGWRLEIKRYPLLTEVGSVRARTKIGHHNDRKLGYDETPYGGFYTQDQVRDILKYASERHVTVIPEIEMPGHSQEALAAYPYLGCRGEGYKVREHWAISNDIMCVGKESTFEFIFNVLDEVCELFPGEYINIGGDEVRTDEWKKCPACQQLMKEHSMTDEMELQRYMVSRVEKYLLAKGKKMIGWGEIFKGCSDPSTTVLSWRGAETGIEAAKKGMHSVMCPGAWLYLDYYQTPEMRGREPVAIHANRYTTLEKTYSYEPLDGVPEDKTDYVLGVQANLWSEYIPSLSHLQHMALPRLAAASEVAWSGREHKTSYIFFKKRLIQGLLPIYETRGYNYADYEFQVNASAASRNDTLRVLAIGDAYSAGIVEHNLCDIALADRHFIYAGSASLGPEASLQEHLDAAKSGATLYSFRASDDNCRFSSARKVSLEEALNACKWDVVTIQQSVGLAGDKDSFAPLPQLVSLLRTALPQAKILLCQTNAFSNGTVDPSFGQYNYSMPQMYRAIVSTSTEVCRENSIGIVPCGTAIQNARHTTLNDNFTADGKYPNAGIGRFIAACTLYGAATGRLTTGNIHVPRHVPADIAVLAQLAADSAVRKPYGISDFGFKLMRDNRVEERVVNHPLPDPLTMNDGSAVKSKKQWEARRRELLEMFTEEIYGRMPEQVSYLESKVLEVKPDALNGLATRKRVAIYLDREHKVWIDMLLYTPNSAKGKKSPVFLGINFWGNSCCTNEPDVLEANGEERARYCVFEPQVRGFNARRWPLEAILSRGYGVATFYRGDICPDYDDVAATGVRSLYPKDSGDVPGRDQWGAVSAWAWGLSRAMDYLETDDDVDSARVAVIGHSRLGKTALWAGANDRRFAMIVSNDSGCTGATLSRRDFGETVKMINWHFPHWFCDNYDRYNDCPEALPVDQHELISLCAPRPVCVGSADGDLNADPEGERLSLEAARPVYELFGAADRLNYHIRKGGHDILLEDWEYYLDHADRYMK